METLQITNDGHRLSVCTENIYICIGATAKPIKPMNALCSKNTIITYNVGVSLNPKDQSAIVFHISPHLLLIPSVFFDLFKTACLPTEYLISPCKLVSKAGMSKSRQVIVSAKDRLTN